MQRESVGLTVHWGLGAMLSGECEGLGAWVDQELGECDWPRVLADLIDRGVEHVGFVVGITPTVVRQFFPDARVLIEGPQVPAADACVKKPRSLANSVIDGGGACALADVKLLASGHYPVSRPVRVHGIGPRQRRVIAATHEVVQLLQAGSIAALRRRGPFGSVEEAQAVAEATLHRQLQALLTPSAFGPRLPVRRGLTAAQGLRAACVRASRSPAATRQWS